jgi:photosystem II stability/assembly factor-like uncharacterized protein
MYLDRYFILLKNRKVKIIIFSCFFFGSGFHSNSQTSVISILPLDSVTYIGTDHGVFAKKKNEQFWKNRNSGLPDQADISVLALHKKIIFGATLTGHLFMLPENDTIWNKNETFPNEYNQLSGTFSNDTALFFMDRMKGIIYTTDHGRTWKKINVLQSFRTNATETEVSQTKNKKKKEEINSDEPAKIKMTDFLFIDNGMLAAVSMHTPGYGIYQSYDYAKSWKELSYDLQKTNIKKIFLQEKTLYCLSSGLNAEVFISEDAGLHWEKLQKTPLRWTTLFTTSEEALFAGNNREGICVSYDKGKNWTKIESLQLKSGENINLITFRNNQLIIGTTEGIYFLKEENGYWKIENNEMISKVEKSFFYAGVGTKNGVTLYAAKVNDLILFKAENNNDAAVNVEINFVIECNFADDSGIFPPQKLNWMIKIEPHAIIAYETHPQLCAVGTCKYKTNSWEITDWKVKQE